MRPSESYRGNRRNFFRDAMGNIRNWRRTHMRQWRDRNAVRRGITIVHPTLEQSRRVAP